MKKFLKLVTILSLLLSLTAPSIVEAATTKIPTEPYDYTLDGPLADEALWFGKHATTVYSESLYSPVKKKIYARIDSTCNNNYSDATFKVQCIDSTTKEIVGTYQLTATSYQYITVTDLTSSHYYYFKFTASSKYDIAGTFYVSKTGTFDFKTDLY